MAVAAAVRDVCSVRDLTSVPAIPRIADFEGKYDSISRVALTAASRFVGFCCLTLNANCALSICER